MKKFFLSLALTFLFISSPQLLAQPLPATCDDLVTDIPMWGQPARGVDLRAYTNSTLHWIGCPTNGCAPEDFFCNFDPATETLSFGSTGSGAMRAAVDPGNAEGDVMPDVNLTGCCDAENPLFGVCNAPDANNNGVPIDAAEALCFALGYESGSLTWIDSNTCPEANTLTPRGSIWSSDFVDSNGFGQTYTCVGFRGDSVTTPIPTLSEWGMTAMAAFFGMAGLMAYRRRKQTA
ncbi:MAG: IPTL-CTERM sorting domain-containing protein [Thermodesulfobacteriota bacterium]